MKSTLIKIIFLVMPMFFVGCSSGGDQNDLKVYIQQIKNKPSGNIEPLPAFRPYEPFIYGAAIKRSPFDKPLDVKRRVYASSGKDVNPDFNRPKEHLERFDLSSLKMVGVIEKQNVLWALLSDKSGTVHSVKKGNYVGKNHGRIVEATEIKIELIEIVSDGLDGWLERPSIIALAEEKE
ncbi:MAG: type IV pilus assembly protein PilP [Lentisphaeria bacterium]|jgi:type IV pilus assembly protein PilP